MSLHILAQIFFSHSVDIINSSCFGGLILGKMFSTVVKSGFNGKFIQWLIKEFHNDLLNQLKQCYDWYVDKCAFQNRFIYDFCAFSKKSNHVQIALIPKRFEPQEWDWCQMVELLKQFQNPTNFSYLSLLELYLILPMGERRLISQVAFNIL